MSDTKTCENPNCGKTMTRSTKPGGDSKSRFATRRFCCQECRNEANERDRLQSMKTCKGSDCAKVFARKARESRNDYMRRSYCSIDCSRKDNNGRRRVLPRRTAQLVEVVREPGQPWRPSGWTQKPNVYAGARQGC